MVHPGISQSSFSGSWFLLLHEPGPCLAGGVPLLAGLPDARLYLQQKVSGAPSPGRQLCWGSGPPPASASPLSPSAPQSGPSPAPLPFLPRFGSPESARELWVRGWDLPHLL